MSSDPTLPPAEAVLRGALATLGLTAAHHVYGAVLYDTPWRLHAVAVAAVGSLALGLAARVHRRDPTSPRGRVALAILVGVAGALAVGLIGLYEGWYNHVLKNLLYFGGLPLEELRRLFPPPKYELPNDLLFEVSGIAQAATSAWTALAIGRLVRTRSARVRAT